MILVTSTLNPVAAWHTLGSGSPALDVRRENFELILGAGNTHLKSNPTRRTNDMKRSHLILATAILFSSIDARNEDPTKPSKQPATSLDGNTLVHAFYLDDDSAYVLSGIEEIDFHGIKCIKGNHVDQAWIRNRVIYIPVAKIITILEYASFDEYIQNMEAAQKERLK